MENRQLLIQLAICQIVKEKYSTLKKEKYKRLLSYDLISVQLYDDIGNCYCEFMAIYFCWHKFTHYVSL